MNLRMFTCGSFNINDRILVEVDDGRHLLVVNLGRSITQYIGSLDDAENNFYTFDGVPEKDITHYFVENFQYNEILKHIKKFLKDKQPHEKYPYARYLYET